MKRLIFILILEGCHDSDSCHGPGDLFGPCVNGGQGAPVENCDEGLACFTAKSGHMCVPIIDDTRVVQDDACASVTSHEVACLADVGACFLRCHADDTCDGDMVCDADTNVCVYTYSKKIPK